MWCTACLRRSAYCYPFRPRFARRFVYDMCAFFAERNTIKADANLAEQIPGEDIRPAFRATDRNTCQSAFSGDTDAHFCSCSRKGHLSALCGIGLMIA